MFRGSRVFVRGCLAFALVPSSTCSWIKKPWQRHLALLAAAAEAAAADYLQVRKERESEGCADLPTEREFDRYLTAGLPTDLRQPDLTVVVFRVL